ncbi:MAG TPA: hypothetical protein VF062_24430 [Candidatus Limnocylindrales bacterium]
MPNWEESSVAPVVPPLHPRKLAKVPFVELADGRLQGVVSSGSDIERVYVSAITAGTHALSCSTNNNRPCGGLSGAWGCKHLHSLAEEAVLQYGAERVARFLRVEPADTVSSGDDIMTRLLASASVERGGSATVFSRFLRHLAYLELLASGEPIPELQWFPSARVGGR